MLAVDNVVDVVGIPNYRRTPASARIIAVRYIGSAGDRGLSKNSSAVVNVLEAPARKAACSIWYKVANDGKRVAGGRVNPRKIEDVGTGGKSCRGLKNEAAARGFRLSRNHVHHVTGGRGNQRDTVLNCPARGYEAQSTPSISVDHVTAAGDGKDVIGAKFMNIFHANGCRNTALSVGRKYPHPRETVHALDGGIDR